MNYIKLYEDYFDDKPKFIPSELSTRINTKKPYDLYNILDGYAAKNGIKLHKLIDNIANGTQVI